MRIVFMGTPDYAVHSLRALLAAGYEVAGVFTQPDKPSGRGGRVLPPPVKVFAEAQGIPVFQPVKIRRDGVAPLRALAPDLCVTAAFGQILSQEILDIPPLGTINVHASLLPAYRGSAPIAWCLIQGETRTGVTTMMTDRGIDTGDILLQKPLDILPEETAGELTQRLSDLGAALLLETLAALEAGSCPRIPQDERLMSYYPMLTKDLGRLQWTRDAQAMVNLIRGLSPWPAASTGSPHGTLRLLAARAEPGDEGEPGTALEADGKRGLLIKAGHGALRVLSLQAPGGKAMRPQDYLRGHPLPIGADFKTVVPDEEGKA
ncbi:MAG: methionyl-tRNA formyltransferase [Christensenellales bacterium]